METGFPTCLPIQAIVSSLQLPEVAVGGQSVHDFGQHRPCGIQLLPELHTRFPGLPSPLDVEPQQAQARLFAALTQLLLSLVPAARPLLCLDDVH